MELLLTHGAQLGLVDRRGRTCLHCAASSGRANCLVFALEFGADEFIEVKQDNGFTCLHAAIRANNKECVEILLQAGADLAAETADGCNAYELASKQKNGSAITKILLEHDATSSGSYSGSSNDESYDTSLSGDDLFRGLNTYTVTPAPKKLMPPMYENAEQQTPSTYWTAQQTPMTRFLSSPMIHSSPIISPHGHIDFFNQGLLGSYRYNTPGSIHNTGMTYNEYQFVLEGEWWTQCFTGDGYPYYYNTCTNVSTWDDPRISSAEQYPGEEQLDNLPQTPDTSPGQTRMKQKNKQEDNTPMPPMPVPDSQTLPCDVKSSPALQQNSHSTPHQSTGQTTSPNHKMATSNVKELIPAASNQSTRKESPSMKPESKSINIVEEKDLDPRAALIDMLKKRNPPIESKKLAPEAVDEDETPDPKAALMNMLKQRNSSHEDSGKSTDTPPPLVTTQTENANADPRTALMAMLKARNASISDNSSKEVPTTVKKSPKQSNNVPGSGVDKSIEEADTNKALSKDELMKDLVLDKYMKMSAFGVSRMVSQCHLVFYFVTRYFNTWPSLYCSRSLPKQWFKR
jgi:hypothetical protein